MGKLIKNSWALFLGYGILIVAHGLQGNLLGLRAVLENFNIIATGALMSGYFIGYFIGANVVPNLVGKVGHIRVFAAFASTASLSILLHSVIVDPYVWIIGRFITGFSIISIFVVVESWLNDRATNKTRGQILSAYMIIIFIGMGIGMLLLNISTPKNYEPFILVSLLMSLALVPILLTKRSAPKFKKIGTISVEELYKISPLGTISSFCTGAIHSGLFSLTAVYAALIKFTIFEISILLFIITVSGVLTQAPIGYLSDKFDRRLVIILTTFGSAAFALLAIIVSGTSLEKMYLATELGFSKILFFISIALYAGLCLPLFSLNLAHTNDFVPKEKFVAAGGGLQLIFGIGAIGGPILCTLFMSWFGVNGFFIFLITFHIIIGVFALHRMKIRKTEDNPDSTFTPLPTTITPVGLELDPDTPAEPINDSNNGK